MHRVIETGSQGRLINADELRTTAQIRTALNRNMGGQARRLSCFTFVVGLWGSRLLRAVWRLTDAPRVIT